MLCFLSSPPSADTSSLEVAPEGPPLGARASACSPAKNTAELVQQPPRPASLNPSSSATDRRPTTFKSSSHTKNDVLMWEETLPALPLKRGKPDRYKQQLPLCTVASRRRSPKCTNTVRGQAPRAGSPGPQDRPPTDVPPDLRKRWGHKPSNSCQPPIKCRC